VQYYEMFGNRAIYADGWKAVTLHGNRMPWVFGGTFDFDQDVWELYNINEDPTETNDLAAKNPQKLDELKKKWDGEALKYNVYPLYDDIAKRLANVTAIFGAKTNTFTYYPPGAEFIAEASSPPVKNRSHTITASVETDGKTDGVIVASGGYFAGYTLYVKNNIVTYAYNYYDQKYTRILSREPLTAGKHEIKLAYEKQEGNKAKVTLLIDGEQVGQGSLDNVVLAKYSISEPFDVGVDNGGSVDRKSYTSPFKFSDTLNWVRFDLSPAEPAQK
jgi:arylsulfatase